MPGYTIEVLDNLLEKMLEKIKNIISQLDNVILPFEEYSILIRKYEIYAADYSYLLDDRMDLYLNIQNRR